MGNKQSAIEEAEGGASSLVHFDHSFKAVLESSSAGLINPELETVDHADVMLTFKPDVVEITSTDPKTFQMVCILNLGYHDITELCWDHATSSFKISTKCAVKPDEINTPDPCVVLQVENSLELEHELRLRLKATGKGTRSKLPPFAYVGMFAGSTKPKPFQRKRPNLTKLAVGKLPPLAEMRERAIQRHRGMYQPTPAGYSRRMEKAIEHIETGCNMFEILDARPFKINAKLIITDGILAYGQGMDALEVPFEQIADWNVCGRDGTPTDRPEMGLTVTTKDDRTLYFNVRHLRDLRHTLEFFWNRYQHAHGYPVKPMSTHGRPLEIMYTLQGEVVAPPAPQGSLEIVDSDGQILRPGARRRSSSSRMILRASTVSENLQVKKHWNKVVSHQGWLLKKGGAAKQWMRRYFVLYATSQGHFLSYYSDVANAPLFGGSDRHRNMIDLGKVTFIRPVSNNREAPDHSFDVVTIEREWTLCAENKVNMQKWLQLITRAVDEDVAILPDDVLRFDVKTRADPTGILSRFDYSTVIEVSSCGVVVKSPMEPGNDASGLVERFFWVYTDFYKWSILSQHGKVALLLNVFADARFDRRQEFIFRTKEAVRMATAIEFYIEKFMSVMHLTLEGDPSAHENGRNGHQDQIHSPMSIHQGATGHDWDDPDEAHAWASDDDEQPETQADLLGFDENPQTDSSTSNEQIPAQKPSLGVGQIASFDSNPPPSNDPWSSTPFDDPFDANSPVAKELSTDQQARNASWYRSLLFAANASAPLPLFDDGTLHLTYKAEFRGSQARLEVLVRNNSDRPVTNVNVVFIDPNTMLRHQMNVLPDHLDANAEAPLQIMVECMRPAANGPQLQLVYAQGRIHASSLIPLPVHMCSFGEPIPMAAQEFGARWQSLNDPNQEAHAIVQSPLTIAAAVEVLNVLKFAQITDTASQCVVGGATLKTGATLASGEKINVGCLVKIQIHPQGQAFRIDVRTVHTAATGALLEVVRKYTSYVA